MDYEIARARPDDLPFVLDTWARSYRRATSNRRMPTSAFHAWHRPRMLAILERRPLLLVAHDRDTPNFLYGWLCAESLSEGGLLLHYAHTKATFQRDGIFQTLLGVAERVSDGSRHYTHRTHMDRWLERQGYSYQRI